MTLPKKLRELQDLTDQLLRTYGTEPTSRSGPERQVVVPLTLWPELEWLEDGPLSEAVGSRAEGGDAEGEEEGPSYVFYVSGGLEPGDLGTTVQDLLDRRAPGRFRATVTADDVVVGRA